MSLKSDVSTQFKIVSEYEIICRSTKQIVGVVNESNVGSAQILHMSDAIEPPFLEYQRVLAEYLRDPEKFSSPRFVDARGVAVYRNAIFANASRFLGDNFPKVKEILGDEDWTQTVRDYIRQHRSETPLFAELPSEFLNYFDNARDVLSDPPFLYELAHFELLENIVLTDESTFTGVPLVPRGDPLTGRPVLNPTSRLVRYTFPVHRIGGAYQPIEPPDAPTFILAFRDRANGYKFLETNAATALVVEILIEGKAQTGETILMRLASELDNLNTDSVRQHGSTIFEALIKCGAILGVSNEMK